MPVARVPISELLSVNLSDMFLITTTLSPCVYEIYIYIYASVCMCVYHAYRVSINILCVCVCGLISAFLCLLPNQNRVPFLICTLYSNATCRHYPNNLNYNTLFLQRQNQYFGDAYHFDYKINFYCTRKDVSYGCFYSVYLVRNRFCHTDTGMDISFHIANLKLG